MKVMALDEGETRTSVRQIAMNGNAVFSAPWQVAHASGDDTFGAERHAAAPVGSE